MPEYLAPGVYVEEVDTGSKPIEGVSTSTAGMLGVTERGPVNVPILVTSLGEFTRWFGEKLNVHDFSNGPADRHCYLPHAVQGFFENGGKRVYVLRVLDTEGARHASTFQFDRGDASSADTLLLRAAGELTGTAANLPRLVVLDASALAQDDWIRIGDGSVAEYHQVDINPVGEDTLVALHYPLSRSHDSGETVDQHPMGVPGATLALVGDINPGADSIVVSGPTADVSALADNDLLEIGSGTAAEYRYILGVPNVSSLGGGNSQATIPLDSALMRGYVNGASVREMPLGAAVANDQVDTDSNAGDRLLFVTSKGGQFNNVAHLVVVNAGTPASREVRRIGELTEFELSTNAYEAYPTGTLVEAVTMTDDERVLNNNPGIGDVTITLDSVAGLVVGQAIILDPAGANRESAVIRAVDSSTVQVTLAGGLVINHALSEVIIPAPKELTAASTPGSSFIALDNRMGLVEGMLLRIGNNPVEEFVTIQAIPGRSPSAPDAGNLVVTPAINRAHNVGTEVFIQAAPALDSSRPAMVTALAPQAGDPAILITDGNAYAANDHIRLTTQSGEVFYHRLSAVDATGADIVTLRTALHRTHPAGSPVVGRDPLFQVQALDAGAWGNRLRISVEDEGAGLVSRANLVSFTPPNRIRLSSAAGVEPGTVLEIRHPDTEAIVGGFLKVVAVNRANGDITLAAGLDAAQQAAMAALPPGSFLQVRSREFSLTVRLLRQPDLALPSRNDTVIASEIFRHLSLDPRHSRYLQTVVGDINGPLRLADRRPEGESWYIRVHDLAQDLVEPTRTTTLESVRLGPEALVDILPDGRMRPARHRLEGGDDSIATLIDDTYIGVDDPVPENRTGLHALRNIDEISIVGCPGRISATMQGALITHCELMRYRFSVLDGPLPPRDSLNDVQTQRQQFDTKYAALYYPWLLIRDPYPTNLARIADYPIPPSGHMLGVYARTDIERGVHKAPANEVVRGIIGLQRLLTKEQQDILNPSPVNINVIRDFRPDNRGIRVFGGRVITSDTDWKYVNVRRLLIFIEASLDRGLQWVVFEPNAEPLWARVRRSISNFLTVVWRNGALEGTTPEEAYFVKCDRTTMTQTDIDNGRLICEVGVAPVKPAEFVIIRIGLWTAHAEE